MLGRLCHQLCLHRLRLIRVRCGPHTLIHRRLHFHRDMLPAGRLTAWHPCRTRNQRDIVSARLCGSSGHPSCCMHGCERSRRRASASAWHHHCCAIKHHCCGHSGAADAQCGGGGGGNTGTAANSHRRICEKRRVVLCCPRRGAGTGVQCVSAQLPHVQQRHQHRMHVLCRAAGAVRRAVCDSRFCTLTNPYSRGQG